MQLQRRELLIAGLGATLGVAAFGCSSSRSSESPISVSADGRTLMHVGDSISVMSDPALRAMYAELGFGDTLLNAEVGRRMDVAGGLVGTVPGFDILSFIGTGDAAPDIWVIALGTNDIGLYTDEASYQVVIDKLLAAVSPQALVVWVNTFVADKREQAELFNLTVRKALSARGDAVVADWYQRCSPNSAKLLTDGVHPNLVGVNEFVDVVRAGLIEVLGG